MSRRTVRASANDKAPQAVIPAVKSNGHEDGEFSKQLLKVILSFRNGDFAVRLPSDLVGLEGKIADAFNDVIAVSERRARETARVSRAVGKEGKLKQRMVVMDARGG